MYNDITIYAFSFLCTALEDSIARVGNLFRSGCQNQLKSMSRFFPRAN